VFCVRVLPITFSKFLGRGVDFRHFGQFELGLRFETPEERKQY
jgi:hypothetical protein